MILYIDYREKWFIERLRHLTDAHIDVTANMFNVTVGKVQVECIVTNLEVGDFIIGDSLDSDIRLLVERKTYGDLSSSIKDGRFRQQKQRLLDSVKDPAKIMYIVERGSASSNIIRGAILNLMLKHNYKVLLTESQADTFEHLVTIYKKFKNGDIGAADNKPVDAPVKLISKKDAVGEDIFATQLTAITGVSYNIALCITKHYRNAGELIDAYRSTSITSSLSETRENLLSTIMITPKRKVGKALSKKIYTAMCGNTLCGN
jgi:ERCC4-type nuclease